jgi:hypothetical protein
LYLESFLREEGLAAEEKPRGQTACREKIGSLPPAPDLLIRMPYPSEEEHRLQHPSEEEHRYESAGRNQG